MIASHRPLSTAPSSGRTHRPPRHPCSGVSVMPAPQVTPARPPHWGLKGPPAGIQFFVFPKKTVVHLITRGSEMINVGIVWLWFRKLHGIPAAKGTGSPLAAAAVHLRAPALAAVAMSDGTAAAKGCTLPLRDSHAAPALPCES